MTQPAVSVIMSVRNAQATLPFALASLTAQTFGAWELVVADDGSTDATPALLDHAAVCDPRIRVLDDRRPRGLVTRLNELVAAVRAPLTARMDGDDVSYPLRLERQVDFLNRHPEVDLLGTTMVVFDDVGRCLRLRRAPTEHAEICRRPTRGFPLFHPTWLGRTTWFRASPYATDAARCEDQDLLFRTYRTSRFANLPEPLFGYREGTLVLQNLVEGRRNMARRFASALWAQGRRGAAAAVIAEQALKGAVDVAAMGAGLGRRLPRRSMPPSAAAIHDWGLVWDTVTAVAGTTFAPPVGGYASPSHSRR